MAYHILMMNIVEKARLVAEDAHAGTERKYTGEPYFTHVEEVAGYVQALGGSEDMVAAAYLHDVVEDTEWTHDDIKREFNPTIAEYVYFLTNISIGSSEPRRVRKAMDRAHIKKAPIPVKTIKLADLKSNLKDIAQNDPSFAPLYMKEKVKMLGVLTDGHPSLFRDVLEIMARDWAIVKEAG
jgi:(p)ppGpp synthase/HD superfamily hydrolase